MRSINGNPNGSHKEQREINGNRKLKIHTKTKLPEKQPRRKRQIQSRPRELSSPGVVEEEEEYNVGDELVLYSDMEEIGAKTPEPEQRAFKSLATTVRPLLQLFQEDSYPIKSPASQTVKKPNAASPSSSHDKQVLYKDICLSSEEEEFQQDKIFNDSDDVGQRVQLKSKHVGRFSWTPKSTNLFLDLWEKNLKDVRGIRKNSHIHREMVEQMREYGPSAREIKTKIDNMSRKYRLEEEKIKTGSPTNWRYFNRLKSLLTETPSVYFEEILFDNTESSSFFQTDNSDSDSKSKETPCVESILHGTVKNKSGNGEGTDENEHTGPTLSSQSSREKEHNDELKLKQYRTDRMLQIEEEKLEIERQKLQVMKHISRDLSSISKTLIEVLQNTRK